MENNTIINESINQGLGTQAFAIMVVNSSKSVVDAIIQCKLMYLNLVQKYLMLL